MTLQNDVASFRQEVESDFPTPSTMDAWAFLVTEVAEIGDALIRNGFGSMKYLRGTRNPKRVEEEVGDAVLMLATLANLTNIDMEVALRLANERDQKTRSIMERWALLVIRTATVGDLLIDSWLIKSAFGVAYRELQELADALGIDLQEALKGSIAKIKCRVAIRRREETETTHAR